MKYFTIILTLNFFIFSSAYAAAFNYEKCMNETSTNLDMKLCIGKAYQNNQKNLEIAYNNITKKCAASSDPRAIIVMERLKLSQKSWEIFRDTNCSFTASTMLGGSGETLVQAECLNEMTKLRINELKKIGKEIFDNMD